MEQNDTYPQEEMEKKGSVIGGIIGALVGALIGAALWAAVGIMGYIASIVGFVIAFLADKGYDLLKGRQGVVKIIVLILCVVLAVAAGTLGTYVWMSHDVYQEELASLPEFQKAFVISEQEFMMEIFSDQEVQSEMLKDGGLGLLYGFMGSFGLIFAEQKRKRQAALEMKKTRDLHLQSENRENVWERE